MDVVYIAGTSKGSPETASAPKFHRIKRVIVVSSCRFDAVFPREICPAVPILPVKWEKGLLGQSLLSWISSQSGILPFKISRGKPTTRLPSASRKDRTPNPHFCNRQDT